VSNKSLTKVPYVSNLISYFSHTSPIANMGRESINENCTWFETTLIPAWAISSTRLVSKLQRPRQLIRSSASRNSKAWMYCLSSYYVPWLVDLCLAEENLAYILPMELEEVNFIGAYALGSLGYILCHELFCYCYGIKDACFGGAEYALRIVLRIAKTSL